MSEWENTGADCGHEKCDGGLRVLDGDGPAGRTVRVTTCHNCRILELERERDEARGATLQEGLLRAEAEAKLEKVRALVADWHQDAALGCLHYDNLGLALVLEAILENDGDGS